MEDPHTVRGLLSRIKSEENRRVKEIATLNFQLQKAKKTCQKLETEANLERDKRKFKENEIIHLRMALDRRDELVCDLEKQLAECKQSHVHVTDMDALEQRHSAMQSKLFESESRLVSTINTLEQLKKSNESLKRERTVLKAKYEQLLQSEHDAIQQVNKLSDTIDRIKCSQEYEKNLYKSIINCNDRDETVQALIDLGKTLPCGDPYPHHHFDSSDNSSDEAVSL
jgi:chromosome segregation ATPase